VYRQDEDGQWVQTGVIGGPKLAMYEMFNHALALPEIVALPDGFKKDRAVSEPTRRVGIDDKLPQRFVLADVDWNMPTERVVEVKDGDIYRVKIAKVKKRYNPKYKI
jgi:anti-sigma factor ChrR (cupin superfamily)